jgi:predicted Rossmann-fold nucleotide-binding protein
MLGQAGYTVMTGGYIGSMEAVSRGAAENGGHVIGETCNEIEAWRPVEPNPWVKEEHRHKTILERMFALIDGCDAALTLPGGPGTLAEVAVMWTHLLTGAISPRPLILIGEGWRETFEQFYRAFGGYIPIEQRRWLMYSRNVGEAVSLLSQQNQM